ncbi:hypothetical protein NPIL_106321 [Nephila pilipes]|uniref:Uncharacterized protein n=1 Tax=Nephila pilipes TaxID=299642 RepID=A0A8X6T5G2_NEPPI|nr:hypothetical protein NPIL_106321 [Nephila pilipes]
MPDSSEVSSFGQDGCYTKSSSSNRSSPTRFISIGFTLSSVNGSGGPVCCSPQWLGKHLGVIVRPLVSHRFVISVRWITSMIKTRSTAVPTRTKMSESRPGNSLLSSSGGFLVVDNMLKLNKTSSKYNIYGHLYEVLEGTIKGSAQPRESKRNEPLGHNCHSTFLKEKN